MSQTDKPSVELAVSNDHMAASHKTGRGYLTGPGLFEFPVEYVVVDGHAIHEGCIDLGPVEAVEAEAERIRSKYLNRRTTEAGTFDKDSSEQIPSLEERGVGLPTTSSFLWTNGVVPYTIASDVPDPGRVDDAIKHIEEMTAIRFVRRTAANAQRYPNYIEIISNGNEGWSSSAIGMRGERQVIRYSDRHTWAILVHEFLHALGVYHEQCRSDRDNFVEIRWSNIQDDAIGNFQKKPDSVDYFDYDYGSIMHYPGTSFAKDSSKPTIVPLQSGVTIGQRQGLSYGDRQTIAKMYENSFPRGYAGVWRAGTGRYALWVNASRESFQNKWQEWSAQGLRLQDIHVRRNGNTTLYSGVFLPGTGAYGLWANVDWDSFKAKWQEWSSQGLRLVDLHVHRVGNQDRYSGVFLPGTGGHGLWVNATWSSFVAKWQEWSSQGLRLVDLNLHQVGNSTRYSGVFLPGNDGHYLWANVTFESLRAKWQELAEQGLRLVDFEMINPDDDLADLADVGFSSDGSSSEIEAFGGIFEQPSLNDVAEFSQALQAGGGGIGTGNGVEAGTQQEASQKNGTHGGVFFPNSQTEQVDEQEGLGGAFLNIESPDLLVSEFEGDGGVVLSDERLTNSISR